MEYFILGGETELKISDLAPKAPVEPPRDTVVTLVYEWGRYEIL